MIDLKDHFAREATHDIESVFLISKSNCAFVNYKTEAACAAAMARFHDSRFHGVRLVCRLRRSSTPSAAPTAGAPATASQTAKPKDGPAAEAAEAAEQVGEPAHDEEAEASDPGEPPENVKERFFVVKSLTIEDLDMSVRTGTWATQAHNESTLNRAYQVNESRARSPSEASGLTDHRLPKMCT